VEHNPFVRFITVFAALIHDVKHVGMPNAQLEKDNHCLCSVYEGSYLERQSIQVGLGIFIEDFADLSTYILQMCPEFLHLVTSSVLATDVSSQERQKKIQDRFERVVILSDEGLSEFEKTQSVVEQILLLADVGHCSQGYDIFLNWNAAFFKECLDNWWAGHGDDPRPGWYNGQIGFIEGYILPLAERCSTFVPHCQLTEGARGIVRRWKKSGEAFTEQLVKQSALEDQERAHRDNHVQSKFEHIVGNAQISTEITSETRSKQSATKQNRKKSKVWKLLSLRRRSSQSIASSTQNEAVRKSERVSSASVAFGSKNHLVQKNQGPKPNRDSTNVTQNSDSQKRERMSSASVLSSANNHLVQENQGPKPNEDSANILEEENNDSVDGDQTYHTFLEFLRDPSGKSLPEAAPTTENSDSVNAFFEGIHEMESSDAATKSGGKSLTDDSEYLSCNSQ